MKKDEGSKKLQLILFDLENEKFGLDLTQMKEINRQMTITPVPNAPAHFEGASNLRGKIVPVVSLRKRLGLSFAPKTEDSRVVILERDGELIGFSVDRVTEVLRVDPAKILPYEGSTMLVQKQYIRGVVKRDASLIILLQLDLLI